MTHNTVGSILRTSQAFCGQLCEKQTLEYGIAYYSKRFEGLSEANQFREVVARDEKELAAAYEEAHRAFAEAGLRCHRWAPAEGCASAAMGELLEEQGFRRRVYAVMVLKEWVEWEPTPEIRVLHARAVRRAYRQTVIVQDEGKEDRELLADAYLERLDDPQFDMFVALIGRQPVGRCALYQVGDIGRVMDLTVLETHAGCGADRALLAHVLSLARRLALRTVCLRTDASDAARMACYQRGGFVMDGKLEEFHREPPPALLP